MLSNGCFLKVGASTEKSLLLQLEHNQIHCAPVCPKRCSPMMQPPIPSRECGVMKAKRRNCQICEMILEGAGEELRANH